MPTLKDIAERVGVSISTVSRVLANESNRAVNNLTKQKIWDAARDLGYPVKPPTQEPQSAAKGIGCIVSTMQDRHYHPYFSVIFEGIDKELSRHGYKLSFTHTLEDLKRPDIFREVTEDAQVEGVILIEGIDSSIYSHIKKHIKHIVGIDVSDPTIPTISYDRVEAARLAVAHLIGQGHRDIMFIGGTGLSGDFDREKRYRGYKSALEQAGLAVRPEHVLSAEWEPDNAYRLMLKFLDQPGGPLPTAVFAASDIMAMAAMRAISEKGYRIPQDFAIVGFDDNEPSRYTVPPLSTIHIPTFEIGIVAAKTMLQCIESPYPLPVKILLPFEPMFRQSSDWRVPQQP
ncbi:LacI family transcriptional regulator [Paenibacillus doosanensis]|uniref:HTH-type transcriptional repressor ExuR n=1 Tax=Paenibacillus konkukensis TaxID=2020716 RepID=A0ABY4RJM9_9BACL|nr:MULTISPECIES: LacI family DNA-binding transcriptional regulator [Paenibacillus]MCS7459817.1 LacI family transcriptional regulator [Paenibacillus doosanensis]UQZ81763.1 putative HTH-type transcriptional repressor ExuR [Paenibacillus konkukensis]